MLLFSRPRSLFHLFFIFIQFLLVFSNVSCHRQNYIGKSNINEFESLKNNPQRIVSLAPNITEILGVLGVMDKVVGVTRYCDIPSSALKKEKIGGFIDVSLAKLISLNPDLVIMTANSANFTLFRTLKKQNISVYYTKIETVNDIIRSIREIGKITGKKSVGIVKSKEIKQNIKHILKRSQSMLKRQIKILMLVGHHPLIAVGNKSYLSRIIHIVGGKNVLEFEKIAYPVVSFESIRQLSPDVVLDFTMGHNPAPIQLLNWLKKKKIAYHLFSDSLFVRPGPRVVKAINRIYQFLSKLYPRSNQK